MAVPPTFAWTATGGTITSAGTFTAGTTTGMYVVTATAQGKSGTASVQVKAPPAVIQLTKVDLDPASMTGDKTVTMDGQTWSLTN